MLNGAKFIEKNIQSIQNLPIPYEHIVVDGGSTDETLLILKEFPKVQVIQQNGKLGMYQAIDQGFRKASGKYITWVNSDDMVIKDGFTRMYNYISNSQVDLVYSNAYFVNESGKILRTVKGRIFAKFLLQNGILPFIQPASMYNKELYLRAGGLDYNNFKITGDLDLFFRFSKLPNVTFKKINVLSVKFLKYGESLGDKNTELGNREKDLAQLPRPTLLVRIINKMLS